MEMRLAVWDDIPELAQYIAGMNRKKSAHIGYCGENPEEIMEKLRHDFRLAEGGLAFAAVWNSQGAIQSAVGADIDGLAAEVWGPFNNGVTAEDQLKLWDLLIKELFAIQSFYFFIHKENERQLEFLKGIEAEYTGEHGILEINQADVHPVRHKSLVSFHEADRAAFSALHNKLFPNTYYRADKILSRIQESRPLRLLKNSKSDLLGYAYYELNDAEVSLEYIGVSPAKQNQGLGTILLKETMADIFRFPAVQTVKLCVNLQNSQAIRVYQKAGFIKKDELLSYKWNKKPFTEAP